MIALKGFRTMLTKISRVDKRRFWIMNATGHCLTACSRATRIPIAKSLKIPCLSPQEKFTLKFVFLLGVFFFI